MATDRRQDRHGAPEPIRSGPVKRLAWASLIVFLLIADLGVWWMAVRFVTWPAPAVDFHLYQEASARWIAGGAFYPYWQLAGPYDTLGKMPILYPPSTVPLFAAFAVLPAVLWWIVPIGIVLGVARHHRTHPTALVVMALLAIWPTSSVLLLWTGNPAMWVVAALALATVWPWAGPLVLLKPSLLPFALWGIRRRSWWISLGVCGILALAFLPMWSDYLIVVRNLQTNLTHSVWNVPLMLVPVVAWAGRTRRVPPDLGGTHRPFTLRPRRT